MHAKVDANGVSTWNNIQEFCFWYSHTSFWQAYFSTLMRSGMLPNLPTENATLFVPNNRAWDAYLAASKLTLQQFIDSPQSSSIMAYHVVTGRTFVPCSSAPVNVSLPTADVPYQLTPIRRRWASGCAIEEATRISATHYSSYTLTCVALHH